MSQETVDRENVKLKLPEPDVSEDQPWADDVLDRRQIAERLTNLIRNQSAPFVMSIHGYWGTGKTFMLKRWQKDLENQGFRAIYFNAWEDDFCDDPLLAIIGQLSEYFKKDSFKPIADKVVEIAIPLLRKNLFGVLSKTTGLTFEIDHQEISERDLLKEYSNHRTSKDELRKHLEKLSAQVVEETGHPMVFIIDELDRCRPTFAIELLERVKHIFDVPDMVFVFGLNRDELCKSLSSVYGDIETDIYLRRFFDFEFNLSEADSKWFAEILMDRFQLDSAFQSVRSVTGHPFGIGIYDDYKRIIPKLMSAIGFSLRDIDYGIRLMALLVRNISFGTYVDPFFIVILLLMKFKKPEFYRSLLTGNFRTNEIMDYIEGQVRRDIIDRDLLFYLDRIEGYLYCCEDSDANTPQKRGQSALAELQHISNGTTGLDFTVISRRAQNASPGQVDVIRQSIDWGRQNYITEKVLENIAALIDTHQTVLRR